MTEALGTDRPSQPVRIGDSSADPTVAELRERGVDTVILAGADTHGIMRGKRVPIEQLARLLEHGMPLCDVFWVMHVDESALVARPDGHEGYFPTERNGYPDILALPDRTTARLVPWHDRTALLLCDWHQQDGLPVPIAPRQVLRRVVERARSMGFEPFCGLELEFYVLRETSGSLRSRHAADLVALQERASTYGVVMGSRQEPIGRAFRDNALAYGIPVEACNPETGPGQFEITLRYGPALTAADDAFLFKSAVKELAAREGLMATFMAKPSAEWAGNSCHVHLSLAGLGGAAAFFDPGAKHGMSETMRHFVGGMLATMVELSAVMAPNVNSYRRYAPYSWAGTTATWGVDNRSSGLRAVLEGEHGTRIEQRQAGGDVNPYLATAVSLAGGLYGIERRIEPSDLIDLDVYALPPGSVPELPHTLHDATERLAGSTMARDWLGQDFVQHLVEMQRAELEAHRLAVTDWEIARYLEAL